MKGLIAGGGIVARSLSVNFRFRLHQITASPTVGISPLRHIYLTENPNKQISIYLFLLQTSTTRDISVCRNTAWDPVQYSTRVELSSWSLRQRGYHHRIPDATPLRALSGVHTPHRRDTRKWSDDYWTRTRTRTGHARYQKTNVREARRDWRQSSR